VVVEMTWQPHGPQGHESRKVRFDVLPYVAKGGIDLGCGGEKVWPHLIGIDDNTDQRLFGSTTRPDLIMRVERLGMFADGFFDSVFSSHTLEHLEDYRAALTEWWRILKVGGYLVLYLPHRDLYPRIGQPGANPDHKHDFENADIIEAMMSIAPDWRLVEDQVRDEGYEYSFFQVFQKTAPGSGRKIDLKRRPARSVGIVRVGGHGDALWASSPAALFKEQGYHVTVYCAWTGAQVLAADPHIDEIVEVPDGVLDDDDLLGYWAHCARKHDRFVNLIGSVERRSLVHAEDPMFFQSHAVRHKFCNLNYLETVHDYCELPHDFRQKYYPTDAERAQARALRAELVKAGPGPVVVLNPGGSGAPKWWPHAQQLMQILADAGVYTVLIGRLLDDTLEPIEPWAHVVGMEWPIRGALAFALEADAVIGTESMVVNAVAMEPMLKVVTMSHSSAENLTKHWHHTVAIEPAGVACHPCHRVHPDSLLFCARDTGTKAAACQASATAPMIAEIVIKHLRATGKLKAPNVIPLRVEVAA
jgi:predicted SAM-dependent methyltransferase/ADP-heptose:LPS heptosyltransferase